MKKIFFCMLIAIPFQGFSQGALNKFKQKVKDRLEQRTNEGTDKEIDDAGKNRNPVDTPEVNVTVEEKQRGSKDVPAFESYSRYDFLPGAQLVYTEDFSQDVVGEFPLLWSTNNRGEVVTIKSQPGKWLRMFQGGHFIAPEVKKLPDNFTVEFDMVLNFAEEGYVYPSILFKLLEPIEQGKDGRKYLADPNAFANAGITIAPAEGGNSTINLSTDHNGENYFNSGQKNLKKLDANYGIPFHVAMWVQKTRLRLWINGDKIYDVPQAIPATGSYNRLALEVANSYYDEEKVGVYISNIRVAEGAADARNKLLTEGKWVTNGILFDSGSDHLKPESAGVLREIAGILNENPTVKVNIVGHTDNEGTEVANKELSKCRAAAVKQALIHDFQVEGSRMQSDGMGEALPVADNLTKEGRAKNRRVEFIKL